MHIPTCEQSSKISPKLVWLRCPGWGRWARFAWQDRHVGFILKLVWRGFPPYPPKKERIGNQKAMPRKRIVVCVWFSSLPFQQLHAFNSFSNILFISPLSPGRASTKSSLSTMLVFMVTLGMVFIPNGWSSPVSKNQLADGWHPKISQGWKVSSCRVFFADLCIFMLYVWNVYLTNRDDQRNPRVSLKDQRITSWS